MMKRRNSARETKASGATVGYEAKLGDRKDGKYRARHGQVLFIDARKHGRMVDRTHRELTDEDIARIASAYHAWRGEKDAGEYADAPASARARRSRRSASTATCSRPAATLAQLQRDDGEPFEEKMRRLVEQLREQQAEAARLDAAIAANLEELGYDR